MPHAIVFGCSGINGWALVNQLLSSSSCSGVFDRVTAVANRPLNPQDAQWPADPRLQVVSGIDLLSGQLLLELKQRVTSSDTISHIYYAGTDQ